ncbi:MAG: RagB/SusD family nutrient uptake outer membrane protein [Weeksellaceae bacterium]
MKFIKYITAFTLIFGLSSCDDYLDIEPKDRVIPETLEDYKQLLITGYNNFPETKSKTELRTDLVGFDEYDFSAESYKDIYLWNDTNYDENTSAFDYDLLYRVIFYTNEVINTGGDKIEASSEKDQLMAEAHALRAYAYFELVNLFSDVYKEGSNQRGVPIILDIDLESNFPPATLQEIYNQIHSDLDLALKLVQIKEFGENQTYHFSELAIKALQSRVNLYQGNYDKALEQLNAVLADKNTLLDLNNNPDSLLPNQVNSVEQVLVLDYAVHDKVNQVTYANDFLMAKYDSTDLRKSLFYSLDDGRFEPVKGADKQTMSSIRTGELYLVKAELLARTGKLAEARDALITLVKHRKTPEGAANYATKIQNLNQSQLLDEVFEERARELAFEGYRWFDLRRYNQKAITHQVANQEVTLQANDPRYTIAFPRSARLNNPLLD